MKTRSHEALSAGELASLSELLLSMYRAANDLSLLGGFLRALIASFEASSATIFIVESGGGQWHFLDVYPRRPSHLSDYEQGYTESDPIRRALSCVDPGTPTRLRDLFSPEELSGDPFFSDVMFGKWGYCDVLSVRLEVKEGFGCYLALTRDRGQPPFDERQRDFLGSLVPHFQAGLGLQFMLDQLEIFSRVAQEQMLQTGQGLIVVGEDGAPVYLNRVAARLTRESGIFHPSAGPLRLEDPGLQERFATLVTNSVTASREGGRCAIGKLTVLREGAVPLEVSVLPFSRGARHDNLLARGGRAVVTLHDSGRDRHDIRQQLIQIYGLSDAEAEVCWRVSNGDSVASIAADAGVTRETVRSQLKRAFAKTGVRRQPELVRLVLLGPAAWLRIP